MRKTIAGLTIGASVLAGGAAGALVFSPDLVNAQADETPSDDTETEADEAQAGEGELRFDDHIADALAPLVEDGTITQAQADAVTEALRAARPDVGRRGPGFRGGGFIGEEIAEVLGITVDELHDALRDGQTLAEIAEANGVDRQDVVDAIVAQGTDRIDEALAAGRIDEEQAAELKEGLAERAEAMVDGTFHLRHHGPGPGFGPHGPGFGPHGPGDDGTTDDDSTDDTDDGTTGS